MSLKERTRWAINYIAKKNGLSNPKIAKHLGVKTDTVNSYRSKLSNPKVDFIIKFCDTFGIDIIWFTKGEGEPFPGASAQFPEICSQSRYEPATPPDSQSGAQIKTHYPVSSGPDYNIPSPYTVINLTEQSFRKLCKIIGIPLERGWKTALAKHLGITPAQLSNTISRESISSDLINKILEKGYPPEEWLYLRETAQVHTSNLGLQNIDAGISLKKLALLLDVKTGPDWIFNLADILDLEPWAVSTAIHYDRISPEMLQDIENKGYGTGKWVVMREQKRPNPDQIQPVKNIDLLKMAEHVLNSRTHYAISLATNIISLDNALKAEKEVNKSFPGK